MEGKDQGTEVLKGFSYYLMALGFYTLAIYTPIQTPRTYN